MWAKTAARLLWSNGIRRSWHASFQYVSVRYGKYPCFCWLQWLHIATLVAWISAFLLALIYAAERSDFAHQFRNISGEHLGLPCSFKASVSEILQWQSSFRTYYADSLRWWDVGPSTVPLDVCFSCGGEWTGISWITVLGSESLGPFLPHPLEWWSGKLNLKAQFSLRFPHCQSHYDLVVCNLSNFSVSTFGWSPSIFIPSSTSFFGVFYINFHHIMDIYGPYSSTINGPSSDPSAFLRSEASDVYVGEEGKDLVSQSLQGKSEVRAVKKKTPVCVDEAMLLGWWYGMIWWKYGENQENQWETLTCSPCGKLRWSKKVGGRSLFFRFIVFSGRRRSLEDEVCHQAGTQVLQSLWTISSTLKPPISSTLKPPHHEWW